MDNVQSQPILVDRTVNNTSGRRNAIYQLNLHFFSAIVRLIDP
jgi:hypothetical protein